MENTTHLFNVYKIPTLPVLQEYNLVPYSDIKPMDMGKDEIRLSDLQRLLLGDAPFEFLGEVFIRTLMLYIALLVILRLLGKRMSGQLTITEMAVMITLGAIVGSPVQIPDRGVLIAIFILICILALHRGLTY